MDSPVAKIIMLAATIAITAAVVLFTWQVVGENTPDPAARTPQPTGARSSTRTCARQSAASLGRVRQDVLVARPSPSRVAKRPGLLPPWTPRSERPAHRRSDIRRRGTPVRRLYPPGRPHHRVRCGAGGSHGRGPGPRLRRLGLHRFRSPMGGRGHRSRPSGRGPHRAQFGRDGYRLHPGHRCRMHGGGLGAGRSGRSPTMDGGDRSRLRAHPGRRRVRLDAHPNVLARPCRG